MDKSIRRFITATAITLAVLTGTASALPPSLDDAPTGTHEGQQSCSFGSRTRPTRAQALDRCAAPRYASWETHRRNPGSWATTVWWATPGT